jgi:hypothetical protein
MIEACAAGEIDDADLGPLHAHGVACSACRQLLELHRDLVSLGSAAPEPADADFDRALRVPRELARQPRQQPTQAARAAYASWRAAAVLAAAAVLLFVAGLWTGRVLSGHGAAGDGGVTSRLVAAIGADAASNRELADVENSRFTYSGVSFRRLDGARVALDFDVTTHVRLVEPVESALVREVLVHALLNPSTTGARLRAMSYAAGAMEPKVREALIFAMHRDESLAVRLKALAILSDLLGEPEVQSAVLATLRDDESVPMRLLALDYLAAHRVDRARIREVIEQGRPGDEALLVRLASHEERL